MRLALRTPASYYVYRQSPHRWGWILEAGVSLLVGTAVAVACTHTLLGPDHYLPFLALARAGRWGERKTVAVTLACGFGHVFSSVVIGAAALVVGAGVASLMWLQSMRGVLAAWIMIGFGAVYAVWGVRHAWSHRHGLDHHVHTGHRAASPDRHADETTRAARWTPWALFCIFVLGPCEPLIPILMLAGARGGIAGAALVAAAFTATTLTAMVAVVVAARRGLSLVRSPTVARYSHALAGMTIWVSGAAVAWLGL
jgi:sulfite exporter TauE/SafE